MSYDPRADSHSSIGLELRQFDRDWETFSAAQPATPRGEDEPGQCTGFSVFKFGERAPALGALAIREFGLRKDPEIPMAQPTKGIPAKSAFAFRDTDGHLRFHFDSFPIGGREFQVDMFFNLDSRFYRYQMNEMGSWGARAFDIMTEEREGFIAGLFSAKFGDPTGGGIPSFASLHAGENACRTWSRQDVVAGTEIVNPSTFHYYVRGYVMRPDLAAVDLQREEESRQKQIKRGAKDF